MTESGATSTGGADQHPEEVLPSDTGAQLQLPVEGRLDDEHAKPDEHDDGTAQVL